MIYLSSITQMLCNAVLARCSGRKIRPVCLTFTRKVLSLTLNASLMRDVNASIECRKIKMLSSRKIIEIAAES